MKKLKVLQIIPSFGVGGAEKIVLDYLTYFDKNKVEIKAISMYQNMDTIYDRFIKENKLDVVYLDKKPGLDLSIINKINKVINDFNPNIIHSHLYTIKYYLPAILNKKKIKIFHTIHSDPEYDGGKVDKYFNKIAFKYFNCTPIALSNELKTKVDEFYGITTTIVINNAIDFKKFSNVTKNKEEIKQSLNLPIDSFIIGHVGRFVEQKNHKFIINVFNEFSKIKENTYLILVGEGKLKKEIEDMAYSLNLSNRIKFLGVRNDIPELLKIMNVFLFPSMLEGFPLTLIEAQAAGVRCVISNKIDDNTILSKNTVCLDLNQPIADWCKALMDTKVEEIENNLFYKYDIKHIVDELEKVYRINI